MNIPESLAPCYARTLRIETRMGAASSFVMNYGNHQWLVTANHVVEDKNGDEKPYLVCDPNGGTHSRLERVQRTSPADVAVFRLWTEDLFFQDSLEPYGADWDVRPTQHVYFLGFPDLGEPLSYSLRYVSPTTPFIKQAIVSGDATHRSGLAKKIWLLDGMGHHGFSGGPVLIRERDSERYRVLGVMSGYVPSNVRVLPGEVAPDPTQVGGAPPLPGDALSETNSGLAICFDIEHAIADIDAYLYSLSLE